MKRKASLPASAKKFRGDPRVRAANLARACDRHGSGEPLTATETMMLVALGRLVLCNEDPRPLFHAPAKDGRPSTPKEWIAVDVLLRGADTKVTRGAVADRWQIKEDYVRGIMRTSRARAERLLTELGEEAARHEVERRLEYYTAADWVPQLFGSEWVQMYRRTFVQSRERGAGNLLKEERERMRAFNTLAAWDLV
jgi:hypothetical protein